MFNFNSLKITKRCDSESTNSFVGIRRNKNGDVEFRLPHGFDDFPENDFNTTKKFFFKMYRTFKKFERDCKRNILDLRPTAKDNIEKDEGGYRFINKEDNEVVIYSKIALIENLLEVYYDLSLNVIESRIGREEKIDFSKIDRYLDRATYLKNDVIYIDEMDLPRLTLQYESVPLIDLFCFIVSELQNELEQDRDIRVQELSHRFTEKYLGHEEYLFNEETFENTIFVLKNILDEIDKQTAYKDGDYWRLYESIELFLYGELDFDSCHKDGTFWGINNFSSIWEDMCCTANFHTSHDDILYADTNITLNHQRVANSKSAGYFPIYKKEDFIDPFFIEFRGKRRWMRPDMVQVQKNAHNQINLLDWKYMDLSCFISYNEKVEMDVTKQLCYEFILRKKFDYQIGSAFAIPSLNDQMVDNKILNQRLKNSGIRVLKINFLEIQQIYLNYD